MFKLTVSIKNSSPTALPIDLFIAFKCDESLYRIKKKIIQVTVIVVLTQVL